MSIYREHRIEAPQEGGFSLPYWRIYAPDGRFIGRTHCPGAARQTIDRRIKREATCRR